MASSLLFAKIMFPTAMSDSLVVFAFVLLMATPYGAKLSFRMSWKKRAQMIHE